MGVVLIVLWILILILALPRVMGYINREERLPNGIVVRRKSKYVKKMEENSISEDESKSPFLPKTPPSSDPANSVTASAT